jgi:farnesyl-diphosphate farnesyltransferase
VNVVGQTPQEVQEIPLLGDLLRWLKPVSRSFYLSIRFLPRPIRSTVAVAYLLARASDTIADANESAAEDRLDLLRAFGTAVGSSTIGKFSIPEKVVQASRGGERNLLANTERIIAALRQLPLAHQELVAEVLQRIIRGQCLDIERFEIRRMPALEEVQQLEEYTFLVAGCVGEFWTKLCLLEWKRYSRVPAGELISLATEFGQGLQLINILRDVPEDLQRGRCYLPLPKPRSQQEQGALLTTAWKQWHDAARGKLDAAWGYVHRIRPIRVRFACAVPALIGVQTLRFLGLRDRLRSGVKVPRTRVRLLVLLAAIAAMFPWLDRWIFSLASKWRP